MGGSIDTIDNICVIFPIVVRNAYGSIMYHKKITYLPILYIYHRS